MYGEHGYYYFLGPVDTIAVLLLVVIISGGVAHWYQKRKFLRTKLGKIVLVSILIIVTVISLIGQTQAASLDLFEEYDRSH